MLILRNPAGFRPGDFLELTLAALLVPMALLARPWVEPLARRFALKTAGCMLLLAVLPVALRLAMLPQHPVPSPRVYDEFGNLLVADTLLHFRLANPAHPLHEFFETFFVLQTPAYASIYPIGQGLALAAGRALFGLPWAGVLLSTAAMCSLCYWMLLGWTAPEWALLGGVLAVVEFGPLNAWMNGYWGGSLAGVAGCLVFGALPRLRGGGGAFDGALLGLGIGLHWLVRPYETVFLILSVALFLAPNWRWPAKTALAAALVGLAALAVSLLQNKRITGSWTMLPYTLSSYRYGVPAAFTWQENPQPHGALTREQQLQYKMQLSFRSSGPETIQTYFQRLAYRVRFYRFFFLPALCVALPFFLAKVREPAFLRVALTILFFALGVNFYPFFQPHYLGVLTCLFVLAGIAGLQRLGGAAARWIVYLCLAHFAFWYARSFFEPASPSPRAAVERILARAPGQQLVFVRYWPRHIFQDEWVYNAADIDRAQVVWARDLGSLDNQKLLRYYPNRSAWLLEPDAVPPRLGPYRPEALPNAESPPAPGFATSNAVVPTRGPAANVPAAKAPPLQLEQVH